MEEAQPDSLPINLEQRFSIRVNKKVKELYLRNRHNFVVWEDVELLKHVINPVLEALTEGPEQSILHEESFVAAIHRFWAK